jgi:hypothetical protein
MKWVISREKVIEIKTIEKKHESSLTLKDCSIECATFF